ncbi:helix-turn-helix domain-containing protein [Pseudomonadales bacterium]|nr:helix-turn-helix domain-containing protein [Pseudomonadales bacterium]MDC1368288.1 helix-turn-helix domain-containing protein [Pseudomonadales bacterium]
MELLNTSLRLLTASQIILFMSVLVFSINPSRIRVIGNLLLGAILVYMIAPILASQTSFDYDIFNETIPSLIPSLMLIFVWVVFEENRPLPYVLLLIISIDVVASLWASAAAGHEFQGLSSSLISQLLKPIIAVIAIIVTWNGRENDLVEHRIKIRLIFVGALGLTVMGVATTELAQMSAFQLPGETFGLLWLAILSLATNFAFFRFNPTINFINDQAPIRQRSEDPSIILLLERMDTERIYANHKLRIGALASMMNLPEYQLRKKINKHLGYRNFNQFVNRYRIKEASQRLLKEARTPILTIALDVGFSSISSFNAAFQAETGMSPSVYRSRALPES